MTAINPKIIQFIQANHVLSLSVMRDNELWAASLFYCADFTQPDQPKLIIVSDHKTKHAQWMSECAHIAGTISGQPQKIIDIQGIQFQGIIQLLSGEDALRASTLFYNKFPEAQGFVAPVWQINCNLLKYTDNSLGFGTKLIWSSKL